MPDKQTILVVDDEQDLLDLIEYNLKQEGFKVFCAENGREGLKLAHRHQPDLMLLDIMMPRMTGLQVAERMREDKELKGIPIIFLTAREDEEIEIEGLQKGADDFITKPVSTIKLVSRIRAVLRRYDPSPSYMTDKIQVHDLVIDRDRYLVTKGNDGQGSSEEFNLPRKEFELLYFMASHKGKVLDRQTLINNVWSDNVYVVDRTVDVHVRKLRKKLDSDYIETVKGVGYRFRE